MGLLQTVKDLKDQESIIITFEAYDQLCDAIDQGIIDIEPSDLRTQTVGCDSMIHVYFA